MGYHLNHIDEPVFIRLQRCIRHHTISRVDGVSGAVKQLKGDVNLLEGNMRGHIQNRLTNVRSVLIQALDKAGKSLQQIKTDVQKGMV